MLETESRTRASGQTMTIIIVGVVVLLAAAGFLFYRHENHPPMSVTAGRLLTIPIETRYKRPVRSAGDDEVDQVTYVVAEVRIQNRSATPIFIKDIHGSFTTADGGIAQGKRIGGVDEERVFTLLPALKPQIATLGLKPMQPEETVAPNATADGYVLLLFAAPASAWQQRSAASLLLDFYHQDSVTLTLPK